MKKIIENKGLLKKALFDFNKFAEDNNLSGKYLSFKNVEDFYNKSEYIEIENTSRSLKKEFRHIENKSLKELSKNIESLYVNIRFQDIYYLLPQIFCKVYNFLLSDKESINIDYYYILDDFINFVPNFKKPEKFSDLENNYEFIEEIIFKVFDKVDKDFKNFEFNFKFELGFKNLVAPKELFIDDKIKIISDDNGITYIEGIYNKGYIQDKLTTAFDDLLLILNILELNKIFIVNDTNKSISKEKNYMSLSKFDNDKFKFSGGFNSLFFYEFHLFKNHLSKFSEVQIGILNLDYFYLLSNKVRGTNLITASNFFGTDIFRFDSKEYLNYWSAIEVMLGSPETNIKKELISKFNIFFPDTNYIEKFWQIRNEIVHRGRLHVESDDLGEIENISKKLFLKLITAS
ncbi:MAG: HEPN domain-containing protein [Candidatus Gracilibacteria bacterium]|nr:HEPN domain-containing protein [Candidatus Gracilibacteria bacterium]MDD2908982.1 HEPN domain-containing protein [Candidatus Gracilibacteria bacterium]